MRETVEAYRRLYKADGMPISNGKVAEELGIGDSTSSRWVKEALSRSYIVNINDGKKGSSLQLVPNELLQGKSYLLPAPESITYGEV
jgi:hypothetical protein